MREKFFIEITMVPFSKFADNQQNWVMKLQNGIVKTLE
jgi:hypothetical protein